MVSPTSFLREGSEVEVRFVDGERTTWYRGVIKKIDPTAWSGKYGDYVMCDVLYEDGDYLTDTELYDKDFNDTESLDAWRFARGEWNEVVQTLLNNREEIGKLKQQRKGARRCTRFRMALLLFEMVALAIVVMGLRSQTLSREDELDYDTVACARRTIGCFFNSS